MEPYEELPFPAKDHKVLERVVREAFSMRRKTIRNTLKNLIDAATLESIGIDTGLRPENLTLEQYVTIADKVAELLKESSDEA